MKPYTCEVSGRKIADTTIISGNCMKTKREHLVSLTDAEILLLEGKTDSQEILVKIISVKAKQNLTQLGIPEWFAPVIVKATAEGQLKAVVRAGGTCAKCNRSAWVHPVYLRGFKKGKRNYNKKAWQERSVFVAGIPFCSKCYRESIIPEIKKLAEAGETRFEIPGYENKVVKENKRICSKCEKACWDFDMKLCVTLMDPLGRYYGICPHCKFKSNPFGGSFKVTSDWRLVLIEDLKAHISGRFTYYQREKPSE